MTPLKPTDKNNICEDVIKFLYPNYLMAKVPATYWKTKLYIVNGFNLCYCLEDCISIIPEFLFYQIKSVNIRDIKKHTEAPKPIQDYLNNNIHILEEIKEIYLINMLE